MTIWTSFLEYFNDLSNFLLLSIVFSVIAVLLSFYFLKTSEMEKLKDSIEEIENNQKKEQTKNKTEVEETYNKYFKNETFFDNNDSNESGEESDGGLMGKLKNARLKKLEETLSAEQKVAEKEIEKEQLATIFDMLKKQEEEFNLGKMGEDDFKAQLSLYR